MPRLKATSRSACSESFGRCMYLRSTLGLPNPMGSISDDWVQDGFVDPFGCIMSIVTQSDLGEKGEASGICGEFDVKRICFVSSWAPMLGLL